jgi:hypothetical protein
MILITGPSEWYRLVQGPDRVGLPLSEDRKRPFFLNIVYSSYLEFRAKDSVLRPTDSASTSFVPSTNWVRACGYTFVYIEGCMDG